MSTNNKIIFYALSRSHLTYFTKINNALGQNDNCIISDKNSKFAFTKIPVIAIKNIINIFIKYKKQEYKYRNRKEFFFKLYAGIKFVDAIFKYSCYKNAINNKNISCAIIYNGSKYRQLIASLVVNNSNNKVFYIERGCYPNTTAIDPKGVNYNNSLSRDPNFFLKYYQHAYKILNTKNKKYIVDKNSNINTKNKYIFIPFQVNTDSQIVKFSPWIKNMNHLVKIIDCLLKYIPIQYNVIFKTHPKCPESVAGGYDNLIKKYKNHSRIGFRNDINTANLIKNASIVCTINSTVGIESLIKYKKVITLGQAFYNIKGLSYHADNKQELKELFIKIDDLKINQKLITSFLYYLQYEYKYQIAVNHANITKSDADTLKDKIKKLL
jgi:capsular polysaccharide export protein